MAAETKSHQHELEEGLLLPVVSDEKRTLSTDDVYPGSGYRGSTTPSTHERTTDRMVKVRRVLVTLVAFLFLSFGLTSVIAAHVGCTRHHGADGQKAMAGPGMDASELSEPTGTAEPDLLHRLLHAYFPKSFQDGVYASDEDALSAVEAEDSDLGATLAQIAKRQDGNNTDPSASPSSPSQPSTPATSPPTSPSEPPVTTSNPPVVTITTTAPPPPVTTSSQAPPPPASSTPGETSTPPAPPPQESTTQAPPPPSPSSSEQPQEPSTTAPSAAASSEPGTSSQAEQSSTTPTSSSQPSTSTFTSLIRTSQTPSPSSSSPGPTTTTIITNTASSASSSPATSLSTTPTTATTSPTSSVQSTQATVVTTTRSSSRAQSSSAVLATRTTTDAEGDLVYVTETSYVGVDPSPQTTSGSSQGGGDLQDAAPRALASGLALIVAAAVGAFLL